MVRGKDSTLDTSKPSIFRAKHIQQGPCKSAPLDSARTRMASLSGPCHRYFVLYCLSSRRIYSLYIGGTYTFALGVLWSASCCAALANTYKLFDDNQQVTRQIAASGFWIILPFSSTSPFLVATMPDPRLAHSGNGVDPSRLSTCGISF